MRHQTTGSGLDLREELRQGETCHETLIEHDLVDEFRLMIDPLVLGGGKRLFRENGALRPLRLVDSQVTSTGAILATYAPVER